MHSQICAFGVYLCHMPVCYALKCYFIGLWYVIISNPIKILKTNNAELKTKQSRVLFSSERGRYFLGDRLVLINK